MFNQTSTTYPNTTDGNITYRPKKQKAKKTETSRKTMISERTNG